MCVSNANNVLLFAYMTRSLARSLARSLPRSLACWLAITLMLKRNAAHRQVIRTGQQVVHLLFLGTGLPDESSQQQVPIN